jgi:hypothetical protein
VDLDEVVVDVVVAVAVVAVDVAVKKRTNGRY